MNRQLDAEALALLEECIELAAADRQTFLDTRCADRPALRATLERMLVLDATGIERAIDGTFGPPRRNRPLPVAIDPYRIVGVLGSGGMGTVLRAERADGVFEQTVAIKLIRGDSVDPQAEERFSRERKLLGRLHHPSIARILDGGTQDGAAYLVMDFVEGEPVTAALDRRAAGIDERLGTFCAICDAVSYAHRNLIVHADIKPSNVLVTADGGIKLIDFGVASLISELDGEEQGPAPYTAAYAAPERRQGEAPSVAGDVYALGVLLREVLPGSSSRSTTTLPRDLQAILHKATEDAPGDRYADVAALADDVRRHLGRYPVRARKDEGWRYEAACFVSRHRRGLALTTVIAIALVAATAVSIVQFYAAERARAEAVRRFDDVRKLSRVMLFDIYDDIAGSPGTVAARVRIAETSRRYLDRLRAVPNAPADLRLESAAGYVRLASVEGVGGVSSLGRSGEAKGSLDKATALLAGVLADHPRNAEALEQLGWVQSSRWTLAANNAGSAALNGEARRAFEASLISEPGRSGARLGRLMTLKNEGYDLTWAGKTKEADGVFGRALGELRRTRFAPADERSARLLESNLLMRLGDGAYEAGDLARALGLYREGQSVADREIARDERPEWLARRGEALWNISGTLADMPGGKPAALAAANDGIASIRRTLSYGPDAAAEKMLFILYGQKALVLSAMGRAREAVAASGADVAVRRARFAAEPADSARGRDLAIGLKAHAQGLAKAGERTSACAAITEASALWRKLAATGALSVVDRDKNAPQAEADVKRYCGD